MCAIALLTTGSALAFEDIDYDTYFPNVVQGHHSNTASCRNNNGTQLVIFNGQINGTNGQSLPFCSSNKTNGMQNNTCDDGAGGYTYCEITGSDINGFNLNRNENKFLSSSGTTNIDWGRCTASDNLGPAENEFGTLILDKSGCELTFASTRQEYRIKRLILNSNSVVNLPAGDYWVDALEIQGGTPTFNVSGDVRFFVNQSIQVNGSFKVKQNADSRFTMIAYNNINFNNSGVDFNGYLYADGNIVIHNKSEFYGRITAGKLEISDQSVINDIKNPTTPFHIQYGKTSNGTVTFDSPFPAGVTPLVFLMPTVSETNSNNDGPASAFLVGTPTATGFSWTQEESPSPNNRYVPSQNMPEMHWIAVTPGTHELSNGSQLVAGTVDIDEVMFGSNSPYTDITVPSANNVLLHQIQTHNNNCWFTTTSQFSNNGPEIAIDTSEVRTNSRACQPANLGNGQIQNESVAYLSVASGAGTLALNGENVQYQFTGGAQTFTAGNIQSLAYQCGVTTTLSGFTSPPIFVAGKNSRRGGDGGWLRRCQLTSNVVSMAVDEDTYRDTDRRHVWENYSFMAFESTPVGVVIDHFEFDHSGGGLTCAPETLILKACANSSCSQLVPDAITANLSPASIPGGGGWVGGNVVNINGGQIALSLRHNTPGMVSVDVADSTPGANPTNPTLCRISGGNASVANCQLIFDDSGFLFDVASANKDSNGNMAKLANKPLSMTISAVKKDDASLQCVPTFANEAKSLALWSSYIDPNTSGLVASSAVSIDGTSVGKSPTAATPLTVNFNAQGQANISLNYPDAGRIQIDAQYSGSGDEAGLVMTGNQQVVSFPVGLCASLPEANASCSSGDSSCSAYKHAGESFPIEVRAKAWTSDNDNNFCDNPNTPNYAHNGMTLGHELVAPAAGEIGALTNTQYDHVAAGNNLNTVTQAVSEVGVFNFTIKSPSTYLGSDFYNIPQAKTGNTGRFVPARFAVSGTSVLPACGMFSYMDQPFPMAMNISAQNTSSAVTKNYFGDFAKATASLEGENNDDGVELSSRLSALPINAGSWLAGVATVDNSYQASFSRIAPPNVDGPFTNLDIGVKVFDNDGDLAYVADPDMRANTAGNCTTPSNTCTAKRISTQDLRQGRVVLANTYGPENETLTMPVTAQYWDGSTWQTSSNDNCSVISGSLSSGTTYAPALGVNETVQRSAQSAQVLNGQGQLLWQNVGSNNYRGQVMSSLAVDNWLQWYWNWDSLSPNVLSDPQASAFFGRYRGHDRIIYWREIRQ
ncbi:hypothetical protein G3R48_12385 [Shewanella intestini]|uniref:DUF6701 domain-containing protein n=2 Tax=Shewanellaceae TaxID=267890 RepID=A0ABS5I423_9GAMM|nr:DUF6701 domain-containing protein [Shewanella intestini]MBR9728775.1 hypothetical protein [Shewanella intestini]MRG36850.1 hypothetical protein [Shewanella sp. XMDDZSB0408]